MLNQPLYDKYLHGRHWDFHPRMYAECFASRLVREWRFKGLLLDLGCGSGVDVAEFTRWGINTLGIDNSEQEVRAAKARYPGSCFERQDMEALRFSEDTVGAFYTINTMHYVDQRRALSEMFRVLRPNGVVYIHFNQQIVDANDHIDYVQAEEEIMECVQAFSVIGNQLITREDQIPLPHTHYIRQLTLRKP